MSSDQAKQEIRFSNGNRAWSISPSREMKADDILRILDIPQPQALIMLAAGASHLDETVASQLIELFNHGIIPAAAHTQTMIIDGGTQAGVMELLGRSAAQHGHAVTLLGVVPAALVSYPDGPSVKQELLSDSAPLDPNHSHFVLVESDKWGSETQIMYALAERLSSYAITLVVNGGAIARSEVLATARRGWPLLVIEGSGRLADEIAEQWWKNSERIDDEEIREIIATGNISLFPLSGAPDELRQQVTHLLGDSVS